MRVFYTKYYKIANLIDVYGTLDLHLGIFSITMHNVMEITNHHGAKSPTRLFLYGC